MNRIKSIFRENETDTSTNEWIKRGIQDERETNEGANRINESNQSTINIYHTIISWLWIPHATWHDMTRTRRGTEGRKNDSRIVTKLPCTMKAKTNVVKWIELNLNRILVSLYIVSINQKQQQITINSMTIKGYTKGKESRKNQSNRIIFPREYVYTLTYFAEQRRLIYSSE